jgi:hypothetical protein
MKLLDVVLGYGFNGQQIRPLAKVTFARGGKRGKVKGERFFYSFSLLLQEVY